jgi:ribonucleotide reductase alpha subunit
MKFINMVFEKTWADRYKKNDETVEDNLKRVAGHCAKTEQEAVDFYHLMNNGEFFPAGRTMSNSGIGKSLTLNNCFVAPQIEDSLDDIFSKVALGARVHQRGGGIGYDFSQIRPKGTPTSNDAIASGAISFMDVFNAQTDTILQGNRRGANMGVQSIYHMDIEDYINAKSTDANRLCHFNLSVMIDHSFMFAVKYDAEIYLRHPVYNEDGKMTDEHEWLQKKRIKARDLWDKLITKAYENGEPGVFFYDNMNVDNNLWYIENIVASNPCVTGDTLILTKEGYKRIDSLVGIPIEIWNGYEYSEVVPKVTGENLPVLQIDFSNLTNIKCTYYHKFILETGERVEAKDLKVGDTLDSYFVPVRINEENKEYLILQEKITVEDIIQSGEKAEKVYCFNEPKNHSALFNGVMTAQCGEYLAGTVFGNDPMTGEKLDKTKFGGACNLGSLFLHNFVENPFTEDAKINELKLKKATKTAVRFLDNIIDINNFPHEIFENYQKSFRTIGLGITGLASALAMLNLRYDSEAARDMVDRLMNFIAKTAYRESIQLAKEKGAFPLLDRAKFCDSGYLEKHFHYDGDWANVIEEIRTHGIRNAKILSVAPTGTLSLTFGNNCSSGIEPIFSLEYDRKIKMGGQQKENEKIVKVRDYAWEIYSQTEFKDIPNENFVTALNIDVVEHIKMLEIVAFHVDMSVSKTINVPTEYTLEQCKEIYMECWEAGIKGCTIFRPNELRQGILIAPTEDKSEEIEPAPIQHPGYDTLESLPWGTIIDVPFDLVYRKYKLKTGCGNLYLFLGIDENEGIIYDCFTNTDGTGGCFVNTQANSRLLSLCLRGGISTDEIIEQLSKSGTCPSFQYQRGKGKTLAKGKSCPSAIANILKDVVDEIKEFQNNDDYNIEKLDKKLEVVHKAKLVGVTTKYKNCPECGSELRNESGCSTCISCGFSKCG